MNEYNVIRVICHKKNQCDKVLVYQNGKYKLDIMQNRVMLKGAMSSESELAAVNLYDFDSIDTLTIPEEVDSYSISLVHVVETSKTIASTLNRELVKVGNDMFVYENAYCNNIILTSKNNYESIMKSYAYIIRSIKRRESIARLRDEKNKISNYKKDSVKLVKQLNYK